MWNLRKGTDELIYKANRVTDVENKFMVTRGKGADDKLGDWDSHIHMAVYKIDNNSTQYSVMAYMGKES